MNARIEKISHVLDQNKAENIEVFDLKERFPLKGHGLQRNRMVFEVQWRTSKEQIRCHDGFSSRFLGFQCNRIHRVIFSITLKVEKLRVL